MVLRLVQTRDASKDGEDKNNNGLPPRARSARSAASAVEPDFPYEDEDTGSCCCCCWLGPRGGRRSSKVSPQGSSTWPSTDAAEATDHADDVKGAVPGRYMQLDAALPLTELLTLDSLESCRCGEES